MNETEQKLLERAIRAKIQAEFLYEALHKIKILSPFDKCFYIAEVACNGYENSKE